MNRAALYARFSTEKQSAASIEDQFRECERVATQEHFEIVARFEDREMSGGTHQRPGYQALLTAARKHEFDVIIAEDDSRLWRNQAESAPRMAELEDLGLHFVSAAGDDTRRDGWGGMIRIKQWMSERARREVSYRTRRGLEGLAIAGKSTGGRAFGYIPARDSASGQIEIDQTEAALVRRVFEMYADGLSPRTIAATLNEEGVPSPGAKWNRSERRKDRKWLASAIHGDPTRGSGILNNRRYLGVVAWGRSAWKRSAADSKIRRHKLLPAGSGHERADERLRIVSQDLWDRVKARQALQSKGSGQKVKASLHRRRSGGPTPKYLLSGIIRCAACEASFVLSNGTRYQCASHVNGGDSACSMSLSVPRERAEQRIIEGLDYVLDAERLTKLEEMFADAQRGLAITLDHSARLAQLEEEIRNVGDAIAKGLVSDALAARLKAAEAERARLLAAQSKPVSGPRRITPATLEKRVEMMRRRLREGGDVSRSALRELLRGEPIYLEAAGGHLEALLNEEGLAVALLELPVAARGIFELDAQPVGNNGSGGRI